MITQFLLDLAKLVIGVCIGSYLGVRITKMELKKEITSYLTNELPHLMKNPNVELQIRKYAHVFFQELVKIIMEDEKDVRKNRENHQKNRK